MSARLHNDLRDFHRFVGEQVEGDGSTRSPEDVLAEWRALHPDSDAANEDLAAIQEAIDELEAGETGIPFEDFDRDFRTRHQLPSKS